MLDWMTLFKYCFRRNFQIHWTRLKYNDSKQVLFSFQCICKLRRNQLFILYNFIYSYPTFFCTKIFMNKIIFY